MCLRVYCAYGYSVSNKMNMIVENKNDKQKELLYILDTDEFVI